MVQPANHPMQSSVTGRAAAAFAYGRVATGAYDSTEIPSTPPVASGCLTVPRRHDCIQCAWVRRAVQAFPQQLVLSRTLGDSWWCAASAVILQSWVVTHAVQWSGLTAVHKGGDAPVIALVGYSHASQIWRSNNRLDCRSVDWWRGCTRWQHASCGCLVHGYWFAPHAVRRRLHLRAVDLKLHTLSRGSGNTVLPIAAPHRRRRSCSSRA